MALEPITRQEKIIAGQDLTPITRMEMFLKQFGGGGGGGSVPKPLTYDYMPEGYPTPSVQTTTLMAEQALAPALAAALYMAQPTNAFEIVVNQTYTVNWDGTEYECVCSAFNSRRVLGNLSIYGVGNDTGEPFVYSYDSSQPSAGFITHDTSPSHTISIKRIDEIVIPMAEEFLPNILETNSIIMNSSTTDSTKKFKITVDDSGAISATEVT